MSIYGLRSDNLEKILFNDNLETLAQTIIRLWANLANQPNSTAPSCDDAIGAVGVSIVNGMDDPVAPPFKRAVELTKSVRALPKVDRSFRTSFNMCGWPLPT
ncbi:hypothetical protein [Ensifer aridi]|uniref:hypothetical protein n=1 Tax=Ensifer aridi TaxID=1708715 RepID=UPI000A114756|nr:hypothetical protein [Ensifer aridi]